MPEPDDPGLPYDPEPLERPLPDPTWRGLIDLDRLLGGRPVAPTLVGVVVVMAMLVGGAVFLLRPPDAPPIEASLPMAGGADSPGATAVATVATTVPVDLVVHAAGAVAMPGVHRLPAGSRVSDLLAAAGGATTDADLDRVNLAAPLADGAQVRFPRIGEPAPAPLDSSPGGSGAPTGPIDLNTATVAELESLSGIGPTIAAAIVEHRDRSGPFRSVDDLLDVPGIGPARLDQLRDAVTV